MDALQKVLIEIVLIFEKYKKNIKSINPTMENLKERGIKGLALSTIILLVIKAEDHNVTKVKGIKLKIESSHYSLMIVFYIILGLLWDLLILTIY